ncbi:MAG: Gfo/Idh/MocA family oxidoreductase [Acidobacteria bacterium]|nr:Gfo/Idh/MocA family oxidoreductase [Acidobacteriota bacterium]
MTRREIVPAVAAASLAMAQSANQNRIGLIGNGNRGTVHLSAYLKMPEVKVTALSDLESSRMDSYNAKLGGTAAKYIDWRELIRDSNVDVVAIAVPNHLHPEMAIAALRAGKHVLLEKPIAVNYKLARQIQAEAKKSGKVFAVGMQRRYMARDHHIQQMVDNGVIGKLKAIQITEYRGDWSPKGWHYTDPKTGRTANWRFLKSATGSTELEFSVHAFSQVTQLVKSPLARCTGSGGRLHYADHETRDLTHGLIDFENGVRFNYTFCLFAPGVPGQTVIVGDKAVLRYSSDGPILLDSLAGPAQQPPALTGFEPEQAEVKMYREFLGAIAEKRESALSAELAIEAAKVAYAIDMAIEQNRNVTARDFA